MLCCYVMLCYVMLCYVRLLCSSRTTLVMLVFFVYLFVCLFVCLLLDCDLTNC